MRSILTLITLCCALMLLAGCPSYPGPARTHRHTHSTNPANLPKVITRDMAAVFDINGAREDLVSPNEYSRRGGLYQLQRYPSEAHPLESKIADMAINDPSVIVRQTAIETLAMTSRDPGRHLPMFIDALDDEQMLVRAAAAKAIGWQGSAAKSAAPALERALVNGDWDCPRAAGEALRKVDPEYMLALVPKYIECLQCEAASDRKAAAYALASIGPYPQAPAGGAVDRSHDQSSLDRSDGGLAWSVFAGHFDTIVHHTGELDPRLDGVIESLIAAFEVESDPQVKWMILRALGKYQCHAAGTNPLLITNLRHEDKWVREAAAFALAEIGPTDEAATRALVEALDDPEERVVIDALLALHERGSAGTAALAKIESMINADDVGFVQENICQYIENLGPDAAPLVPAIISVLEDELDWSAPIYAEAIGRIGPEAADALPALLNLYLGGGQASVVAAQSMARIDPSGMQAGSMLLRGLSSPEPTVSTACAMGLNDLDPHPQYTKALITLLDSSDNTVIMAAAHALRDRGAESGVIEALVAALKRDVYIASFQAALSLVQNGETHPELVERILTELGQEEMLNDHRGGFVAGWLSESDTKACEYLLLPLALRTEPQYSANAAIGLAKRGDSAKPAVPLLVKCLSYDDYQARLAAAHTLAVIEPKALEPHVQMLIDMLNRVEGEYSAEPIWILGEIGPGAEDAIPALTVKSHDFDRDTRHRAAIAIAKICGEWSN